MISHLKRKNSTNFRRKTTSIPFNSWQLYLKYDITLEQKNKRRFYRWVFCVLTFVALIRRSRWTPRCYLGRLESVDEMTSPGLSFSKTTQAQKRRTSFDWRNACVSVDNLLSFFYFVEPINIVHISGKINYLSNDQRYCLISLSLFRERAAELSDDETSPITRLMSRKEKNTPMKMCACAANWCAYSYILCSSVFL